MYTAADGCREPDVAAFESSFLRDHAHLADEGLYLYKNTVSVLAAVAHGGGKLRVTAR